ncbi:hypothetical protein CLV51_11014 [Chitinophaga niastensis]|uniref:Uncharacterized protein n=2 Tax=Chitinophaga niastensis TaxID=536980 RepID=A0A2P8H999_CHINA|nr:hypothetical protein CLV51_11014 [Chitinophaga niastensis]
MFQVAINPKVDSEITTFKDMLDNMPEITQVMAKYGDKFDLLGKTTKRGRIYTGTFCLVQSNGLPPRAKLGELPHDLELEEDEGLGHYTSFFYDPANNVILVQYNRNGITANGIAAYFKANFKDDIRKVEFRVLINPYDITKLQEMSEIKKVELSVAGITRGGILANDGVKRSFSELNDITDKTNATGMNLTLSVGKAGGGIRRSVISQLFRSLINADTHGNIVKMEITGREEDEDALKVIDFLNNKVIIDVPLIRTRHLNEAAIRKIITDAISQYDLIKDEIAISYRVKGAEE